MQEHVGRTTIRLNSLGMTAGVRWKEDIFWGRATDQLAIVMRWKHITVGVDGWLVAIQGRGNTRHVGWEIRWWLSVSAEILERKKRRIV